MPWAVQEEVQEDNTVHTWPLHDDAEHVLSGSLCWCYPQLIEYENGNVQVVHKDELDRMNLT